MRPGVPSLRERLPAMRAAQSIRRRALAVHVLGDDKAKAATSPWVTMLPGLVDAAGKTAVDIYRTHEGIPSPVPPKVATAIPRPSGASWWSRHKRTVVLGGALAASVAVAAIAIKHWSPKR